MAYKNIEDKRAYKRKYMREHRAWLKAHGLCTICKQEDARTIIGKPLCFDCFVKKYGHEPIVRLDYKKKKTWIPKHGIPKSEYYQHGLCAKCGLAPHLEGRRVCQKCYDQIKYAAWLGRKSKGIRDVYLPPTDTPKAWETYQYCLDHRKEYIERWKAEYDCEYKERASAKEQRKS